MSSDRISHSSEHEAVNNKANATSSRMLDEVVNADPSGSRVTPAKSLIMQVNDNETLRVVSPYENATWNDKTMVYGNGDPNRLGDPTIQLMERIPVIRIPGDASKK